MRPTRLPVATEWSLSTAGRQRPDTGARSTSERTIQSGLSTRNDGASWIPRWAIRLSAPATLVSCCWAGRSAAGRVVGSFQRLTSSDCVLAANV